MNPKPLVSIVVITYNSSKYVESTLESCRKQNYGNIELIITDDSSSDDTLSICENWLKENQSRFERVQIVLSDKNTGLAPNFNRGVNAANGEWIKPLAGDDLLMTDCLDHYISKINNLNESCFAYSVPEIPFTTSNNTLVLNKRKIRSRNLFFHPKISSDQQYRLAIRNIEQPSMIGLLIRRAAFIDINGLDERFPFLEDRPFIKRYLKGGYKFHGDNTPKVLHRIHNESISQLERDRNLVSKWMIESYIPVRKEYFFPGYTFVERCTYEYQFLILRIFFNSKLNSISPISVKVYKLLNYPFGLLRLIFKRFVINKVQTEIRKANDI